MARGESASSVSSGTEVLQISLDGQDPEELAHLVNAVTNTYIEEVANGDQKQPSVTAGVTQEAQRCEVRRVEKT